METEPNKIKIYYDGTCRTCSGIVEKLGHSSKREKFLPKDIHTSQLPASIALPDALRDVHVIDTDGSVHTGIDAVARILSEYPKWHWLSKMLRLPGIRNVAARIYRVVADTRHRL